MERKNPYTGMSYDVSKIISAEKALTNTITYQSLDLFYLSEDISRASSNGERCVEYHGRYISKEDVAILEDKGFNIYQPNIEVPAVGLKISCRISW